MNRNVTVFKTCLKLQCNGLAQTCPHALCKAPAVFKRCKITTENMGPRWWRRERCWRMDEPIICWRNSAGQETISGSGGGGKESLTCWVRSESGGGNVASIKRRRREVVGGEVRNNGQITQIHVFQGCCLTRHFVFPW